MNPQDDRCVICLGSFQVPRMLPCSHCFCHQCLQKHITESHNDFTITFLCPLCRRINRPRNSHLPVTLWASCYPIYIFTKAKCENHDLPSDGICFCHEIHLCFRCLLQMHRSCCLSINPARKMGMLAYFQESFDKAVIWQSRLKTLREKKKYENPEDASHLFYIDENLEKLEVLKSALLNDLAKINEQTLESDTLRLVSDDFQIFEYNLANNLKPQPFSVFQLPKKFFTQSPRSLVQHKLLSDNNIIAGLAEEAKIFMISPLGKCICEVALLGRLISIDVFGDNLVIVLLKLYSKTSLEGSCLQYLRCSDLRMSSVSSYCLEKSYIQTVALSENRVVALYYENNWFINILQIKDNTVVTGEKINFGSNVCAQIYPYGSQHIMYTNEIEIFCVNVQDKTQVCLLSESRRQGNAIERISHLTSDQSAIYFADILNASVYKMSTNGKLLTLFLSEKIKMKSIFSFHFNTRGHLLICFDFPQDYMYCLYKKEDFVGWDEDF